VIPTNDAALFRSLFDATSDGVVVTDEHGVIQLVNGACHQLLGYDVGELEGQRVEVLVPARFGAHPAHRAGYQASARARGMGTSLELVARHKDGHELPVDIALTPVVVEGRHWNAATVRDMRGRAYAGETVRVQATALRSAANGVVITDRAGTITWVNPAACAITGYAAAELIGRHTRTLKSGEHPPEFYARLWATVLAGATWSGVIVNRRRDGSHYHEEQTIAPVVDGAGAITHFIAIKQDVTARHRAESALAQAREDLAARVAEIELLNAQLHEQAIRDPLTGMYNRRYFQETIARDVSAAARRAAPIAILVVDVDHFKHVNDRHGHATGDEALVALARLIGAGFRASDIACRFGGEEFVVAMPGASVEVARARAEALRLSFGAYVIAQVDGHPVHATISIGIAVLQPGEATIDAAVARADGALYDAKHAGRNRVVVAGADGDPGAPG
jgi:diguanylate cyclase (GGDEF)-like protein/PAS domain S-box-containing protein